MRGLLLWMVAMLVVGGSALARTIPEHVEAAEPVKLEHREIVIPHKPEQAPERPDFDLEGLAVCAERHETHEEAQIPIFTPEPEEVPAEVEEVEAEPEITYLGDWTITAYCCCEICTGEYANGITASGTVATEGRTVACNSLPMGTRIMIDGHEYTVEDTGYTPYGETWLDLFFEDHESALAWGVQTKEVYLIND